MTRLAAFASLVAVLGLAGCATDPPAPSACDAAAAAVVVGLLPTADAVAQARAASGAATVRVIEPGDVVTLEYRFDRLNLELDAGGRIATVTCG